MAINWLVVVIGASVTYESSFNVYSPLFPPYQLGRAKHLILNLNMVNNDITQMQCNAWLDVLFDLDYPQL
jgi:hypothetical protein